MIIEGGSKKSNNHKIIKCVDGDGRLEEYCFRMVKIC